MEAFINELPTLLTVIVCFIVTWGYVRYKILEFTEEIGAQTEAATKQLNEVFEKPAVAKAMGILGKHSGEVRADNALREKVADGIIDQIPSLGLVLEQFNITPLEGMQLMNDPIVGPWIQRALKGGLGGLMGGNQGNNSTNLFNLNRREGWGP